MSDKKAVNSGIWFTISNFIVRGIGFITTPIFTRLLSKVEFGQFNNFSTWCGLLIIITSLNLEASLIRARYDYKDDLDKYVFSMMCISEVSTLLWMLLYFIFNPIFKEVFSMDSTYILCMFGYLFTAPIINLFQNMERFKYKYKWTVLTSLTVSVGSSLLSVILVLLMTDKLAARTIGFILPTIFIGVFIFIFYAQKVKSVNLAYIKYAIPFTLPFIPHLLSMYLLGSMDKVMINKICGAESLALYSLAYTVGTLISILVTSINNAFSPWLGEKLSKKEFKTIYDFSLKYVMFFAYFGSGVVLITPEILYILGGVSYMEAIYIIPPIAAGCLMQFIYCMYVNVEQYEKKTLGMAFASMIAAMINYALNYFLIPIYGYAAAAYTTFIGYFCLLIMHMLLVKKMKMDFVYKNKSIFIVAVITSLIIFLIRLIMDYALIRYVCCCVYVMIGILYLIKNYKVIDFMKSIRK